MLSPVIMIGCGGSGSKAVRYARDAVTRRLREVGWTDPMPGAWTFLGLDLKAKQEDTLEIPPLPDEDFIRLPLNFGRYRELRDALLQKYSPNKDVKYREHLLGWLPEGRLDVSLLEGAGQYRPVGRAAGLYALEDLDVRGKLRAAFDRAVGPGCIGEVRRVSASLTGAAGGPAGPPIVLVCASMAGGTGAGIALDLVDLLRRIDSNGQNPFLLLFANDIFGDDQRPQMVGNSMGFLSELLSGYWNDEAQSLGPGDFFTHNESNPGHGPRGVFVVSSNGLAGAGIGDSNMAVYKAVGEALSGWATDPQVQTAITSWATGNAAARAAANDDGYPFSGVSQPGVVSSFGAAVVTVGRVRFQRWAQDLLSREIIESLNSGHRRQNLDKIDADQIKIMADNYWRVIYGDEFPERVELDRQDWVGLASTEEIFRPATGDSKLNQISAQLEQSIPGLNKMAPTEWVANLNSAYQYCVDSVISDGANLPGADVIDWSKKTEAHMSRTVSYVLARSSCDVAIKCLNECDEFLKYHINELKITAAQNVENRESKLNECRQTLRTTTGRLGLDRNETAVSGVFKATAKLLLHEWYAARVGAIIALYEKAMNELNVGVRQSLQQINGSVDAVFAAKGGVKSSEVLSWPNRINQVPKQYLPSNIELPLESESEWRTLLEDLCRQTCTSTREHELPMDAARILLVEGDETEGISPFIAVNPGEPRWRPGHGVVSFVSDAKSPSISDRVQSWMYDNDTFRSALTEGIGKYLTPGEAHVVAGVAVDFASRTRRFQDRLDEAVSLAHPLVDVDRALCDLIYGGNNNAPGLVYDVECSQLPFRLGDPGLVAAQEVFETRFGSRTPELKLRNDDTSSILMTMFISSPLHPMVIESITEPIAQYVQANRNQANRNRANDYSFIRTRTLLHAIALPPEATKSMIRGFAIGRLCGYITKEPSVAIKISGAPKLSGAPTTRGNAEEVDFPWPFLSLAKKSGEILPALLESFIQCYAEVGRWGLDAFEAYRRLFKLGDKGDSDYLSDVEQMLQGQDLPYRCLTRPVASKGTDIDDRRNQAIAYLDRNIELLSKLEKTRLTGQESRTKEGYAVGNIHNVALREILPLARKCYEEVKGDIGKIGMPDLDSPI